MKETRLLMGMPVTLEIVDSKVTKKDLEEIFSFFKGVDKKFSPFKKNSETSKISRGAIEMSQVSPEMKTVLELAEKTKRETNGFFDIWHLGKFDPSGIVKGWAIAEAAKKLTQKGFKNFYVDAGGDIQAQGKNNDGENWRVGVRNPFNERQIVKVIALENGSCATSGNYLRGNHIYNPKSSSPVEEIVSLTVVGDNIVDADRFATAAFAMGKVGIVFIENLAGFEGYLIDREGRATFTSNFEKWVKNESH